MKQANAVTEQPITTYHRIVDVLTREEIKRLTTPSDLHGWRAVATSWLIITLSFALVAWWPSVLTVAVALVLLGGRFLGLSILMHECAHRSLFQTKWLNEVVGTWLCAAPAWNRLKDYRTHHIKHHNNTGTTEDPDLCLSDPFPVPGASLRRKLFRDISGITGIKRVYANLMMDFGYMEYTASSGVVRIDQTGRTWRDTLIDGVKNFGPVLVTNAALFATLTISGQPLLYLLWIAAYLTTFSVFVRIRSMAEHAATEKTDDQFLNTRTTKANMLARLTVAPHHVNYHLEHHLLMTVPQYKLPEMHRLLKERGVFDQSPYCDGYLEVLKKMVKDGGQVERRGPEPVAA